MPESVIIMTTTTNPTSDIFNLSTPELPVSSQSTEQLTNFTTYAVFHSKRYSSERGFRDSYGIQWLADNDEVLVISDLSDSLLTVEQIRDLLNHNLVSPLHVFDVIQDLMS